MYVVNQPITAAERYHASRVSSMNKYLHLAGHSNRDNEIFGREKLTLDVSSAHFAGSTSNVSVYPALVHQTFLGWRLFGDNPGLTRLLLKLVRAVNVGWCPVFWPRTQQANHVLLFARMGLKREITNTCWHAEFLVKESFSCNIRLYRK